MSGFLNLCGLSHRKPLMKEREGKMLEELYRAIETDPVSFVIGVAMNVLIYYIGYFFGRRGRADK